MAPSLAIVCMSPDWPARVLQVTNTPWGERVSFVFDPAGDTAPKSLHVSPLMDMQGKW